MTIINMMRRNRQVCSKSRRSWVLKHVVSLSKNKMQCRLCKRIFTRKAGNFTSISRHLKMLHNDVINKESSVESDSGDEKESSSSEESAEDNQQEKRKFRPRSWVWQYFKPPTVTHAECKICHQTISHCQSPANLIRHYKNRHNEIYMEYYPKEQNDRPVIQVIPTDDTDEEEIEDVNALLLKRHEELVSYSDPMKHSEENVDGKPRSRHHSWVWNYWEVVSETLAQCQFCRTVMQTHVGNMSRHIKTKHKDIYKTHFGKEKSVDEQDESDTTDSPEKPTKNESAKMRSSFNIGKTGKFKPRHSWVWNFCEIISKTKARCKLCKKVIIINASNLSRHIQKQHEDIYNSHFRINKSVEDEKDKSRSYVWNYCEIVSDTEAQCQLCKQKFNRMNIGNLNRHIKHLHYNVYKIHFPQKLSIDEEEEEDTSDKFEDQTNEEDCDTNIDNKDKYFKNTGNNEETVVKELFLFRDGEDDEMVVSNIDKPPKENCGEQEEQQQFGPHSWVWQFLTSHSKTHAQCKVCDQNISSESDQEIGNLISHFKILHKEIYITNSVKQGEHNILPIGELKEQDTDVTKEKALITCPTKATDKK